MKIKRLWIEYEDSSGNTNLRPATDDDFEYFGVKPGILRNTRERAEVHDSPTWKFDPYTPVEIEALRLTPGELR